MLVTASVLILPSALEAQTAQFSGAITTLGSGFGYPASVAVDASGNVFVADVINSAVYEIVAVGGIVSPTSTVLTIGSGFTNPQGVAVDASENVFVADFNNSAVKEIVAVGGVVSSTSTVVTIGGGFANPGAVAVDANGNVFVADTNHNAMKEILAVSGVVSSSSTVIVIGGGFDNPDGVAVDASGNVFVADTTNNAVKEIVAVGGVVSSSSTVNTIGSGFIGPNGLAVDASGNVFVADYINSAVFEIVAVGGVVSSGSAVNNLGGGLNQPYGVALGSGGQIYVADSGNGRVISLQPYSVNFGSLPVATSTPATQSLIFTFDGSGTIGAPSVLTQGVTGLDFTDAGTGSCTTNGTMQIYNAGDTCTVDVTFKPTSSGLRYGAATLSSSGTTIATASAYGVGIGPQIAFLPGVQSVFPGTFLHPTRLALDAVGNVFVAVAGTVSTGSFVQEVLAAGGYATVTSLGSGYSYPEGLAVDGNGNVFVADTYNHAVKEILAAGGYTTVNTIGSGFSFPYGIALDVTGNVFVADKGNNTVKEIFAATGYTTMQTLGSGFSVPRAVAVDASANVFVADTGNNAVKEIMAASGYTTVNALAPAGGFYAPTDLSLDGNGNLYVLDSQFNIVEELLAANGYTTPTFVPISIPQPAGIAVNAKGNLFVTDNQNSQVDELDVFDPPSLQFASTAVSSTSASQTVTVNNNGNAALAFEVPITGLNPSISAGFTYGNSSTCPQLSTVSSPATLASGASCTMSISFSPTTAGTISGLLVTTDNVLNATGPAYATQSVSLSGIAAVPITATTAIASVMLTEGHAATAFTPVTASGGTGTLTYSVSPALPAGLVFSATGTVSGAPTIVSAVTIYTVTVTDTNGAATTSTFSLTVDSAITASSSVTSTVLTVGHAATTFSPVTATGGTGTLTYSVSPTLPAGLVFSAMGAVSGTPTIATVATTYTVTVIDANGATATSIFSLTVKAAITATTASSSTALTQGHAATAFAPVTASGGTGTLTYSVSPALPAGLTMSSSGVISGTPTSVSAATTYTVTVTDANGATATSTFSLMVNAAITATTASSSTALTQGHAATAFAPVTASGGTGTLAYSVSPALPAGLTMSSSGIISGTPTVVGPTTTYTVTVTDANGATATSTFSLMVNAAITATTASSSTALTQGHAAAAFTPVTASGGTGMLTFSVSPALPAGLAFSAIGTVSGTPTVSSVATTYTVTITDTDGATTTSTFGLTVNSAVTATTAIASSVLTVGHAATAFTPVTASGGTGTLAYSVSPSLPAGLVFSSTGTVSGTATVVSPVTSYTVTVIDTNGATTTSTFSLTVNSAVPTLTSTSVTSSSLTPTYGTAVVLTATVTPAPTDTPPGTVSFYTSSTLLGTVTLTSTGSATLNITLPLGPGVITAVYSGSANYAGSSSSALSISDRTGTLVTFAASPTTQLYNNPIVLTAQATSSTAGTLTGNVSFLDGTTMLATVPLGANGVATYSVATLADGSHSLTAAYSGDGNFLPSGSMGAAIEITVGDVNLNLGGDQNQSVVPGAAVAYTFPLSPLVTPTFLYDVHLTATGLPPGATYTFSPMLIPAGSASVPVILTIQTAKGVASSSTPTAPGQQKSPRGLAAFAFGLLLPLLGAKSVRRRLKAMPRPLTTIFFATLCLGGMVGMTGCGSSGFYGTTSTSGNYTITVTATSADLVRVSTVQLTIQ